MVPQYKSNRPKARFQEQSKQVQTTISQYFTAIFTESRIYIEKVETVRQTTC